MSTLRPLELKLSTEKKKIQKSQIRPKMVCFSYILSPATQSSLFCLDSVKKHLRCPVGDESFSVRKPLTHRRSIACLSLLSRYFDGKCSNQRHSLDPPVQTFPARLRLTTYKGSSSFPLYPINKKGSYAQRLPEKRYSVEQTMHVTATRLLTF